ncbi:unnamed protein product [Cuscuta europaea]|uniref:Uncharacterized protein n=1 Tax=Cuscuta europaea TaxID=41803 RepID=A0A9P0ZSE9_CUSEU|nr:unnamed protein product [Cuscuta europaea]
MGSNVISLMSQFYSAFTLRIKIRRASESSWEMENMHNHLVNSLSYQPIWTTYNLIGMLLVSHFPTWAEWASFLAWLGLAQDLRDVTANFAEKIVKLKDSSWTTNWFNWQLE